MSIKPGVKQMIRVLMEECGGVATQKFGVKDLRSGSSLSLKEGLADRFTLVLPFALEDVEWEVIFSEDETDPPDFVYDSLYFEPHLEKVPSWANWDCKDKMSLLRSVKEMYSEYNLYQQLQLSTKYPNLFQVLVQCVRILNSLDHIEVYVKPQDKKNTQLSSSVVFLIRVKYAAERIPKDIRPENEQDTNILLKVEFTQPDSPDIAHESYSISPALKEILGEAANFPLLKNGLDLAYYLSDIQALLNDKIETLDDSLSKRKSYIMALVKEFKRGVIEYDAFDFLNITVLINYLDFNFLLTVVLPQFFPEEQPVLIFRSCYHSNDLIPFSRSVGSGYPWSPRWKPEEMVMRLRKFVQGVIPQFQRRSVMYGTALETPQYDDTYGSGIQ